jgi:hypothetical protein
LYVNYDFIFNMEPLLAVVDIWRESYSRPRPASTPRMSHIAAPQPALPDGVAGRIDFFFDGPANAMELMRAGRFRVLAITDDLRMPQLPDVPNS